MSNRRLTQKELDDLFLPLPLETRERLPARASSDAALLWALRRKLAKELVYDERRKPTYRKTLKHRKRVEQHELCAICKELLSARGAVLDRLEAMAGYARDNTRLICPRRDGETQDLRGFS